MAHAIQDATGTQAQSRKRGLISYQTSQRLVPLLYVTPATLLFCLLMLFPMVMVIRYSLMDGAIVKKNAGLRRAAELPGRSSRIRCSGSRSATRSTSP